MEKVQIGWVIAQKIAPIGKWRFPNVKVYEHEKVALRYSHGLPVIPCFVEI